MSDYDWDAIAEIERLTAENERLMVGLEWIQELCKKSIEWKPDLDRTLCEKYPKIFANRHADIRTTAMCWGLECGDGWYQIIDALCCAMQNHCDSNSVSQPVASQIKEKYGTLRFYYDGGDDYTDGMVYLAEVLSGMTCEVCGNPGQLRDGGWLTTRCDAHHKTS